MADIVLAMVRGLLVEVELCRELQEAKKGNSNCPATRRLEILELWSYPAARPRPQSTGVHRAEITVCQAVAHIRHRQGTNR